MRFVEASDSTWLVRLEDPVGLLRALEERPLAGVVGFSPARTSLLVRYDPLRVEPEEVKEWIQSAGLLARHGEGKLVEIPTLYIGEDLEEVARISGCSITDVVEVHSSRVYDAWFLGFVPGFAYLGEVDARIAVGRRAVPRVSVPAGSVGIAGVQTGVYPRSTPGGWNLIGRTDAVMFDAATGRSLIEPGDRVRFVPL